MIRNMRYRLFAFSVTIAMIIAPVSISAMEGENTGRIVATVKGIRSDQGGNVIIALYNNNDNWLDLSGSFSRKTIPVESDSLITIFEDVPYDSTYAIQVIHDKNRNGKLDFRKFPFPKPKEGAGVSNNNRRLGPPEYIKAKFELSSESVLLRIDMYY